MVKAVAVALNRGERDTIGEGLREMIKRDLGITVASIRAEKVYVIDANISDSELTRLGEKLFVDPIIQHRSETPEGFDWLIEVGFKPGVTDNVGNKVASEGIPNVLGRGLEDGEGVYYVMRYYITDKALSGIDVQRIADRLHNEQVQIANVMSAKVALRGVSLRPPVVKGGKVVVARAIDLNVSDEELMRISTEGVLSLSLAEMKAIQAYFRRPDVQEERKHIGMRPEFWDKPTDAELEALAQTWSEHCKHKIFNALIHYVDEQGKPIKTIDGLFKTYIQEPSLEVARKYGWLKSAFKDNAGVVAFNRDWNIVDKCETHNAPSNVEPYGGAATGIGGVIRDVMATGRGGEPIGNSFYYCFGSQSLDQQLPEGLLHPRVIRAGVHQGVIDYGNEMGIPLVRGGEFFDPRYGYRVLVYVRTIGRMPTLIGGEPSEKKGVSPGEVIVMIGGKVGIDGVHGATFSSGALHKESPGSAVQIGDPITEKKMLDFEMEIRELCTSWNDSGAGGFSSGVGEMARDSNGFSMDLKSAPLKYQGIPPWVILISESQERMFLSARQENVPKLLELARRRDVEATVMGTFENTGMYHVTYGGDVVAHLDMDFLYDGVPRMELTAVGYTHEIEEPPLSVLQRIGRDTLFVLERMISRQNLCSTEDLLRRHDHEVKGLSVVKPLAGVNGDVPSDATVTLADYGSREGVIVTESVNPRFIELNPRAGAAAVALGAYGRVIATGGRPVSPDTPFWNMDNFCQNLSALQSDDGKRKLGDLVEECEGLRDYILHMGVPMISGKDSMHNAYRARTVVNGNTVETVLAPPPTLLISAGAKIDNVDLAMTIEGARPGDHIYVVGVTYDEMGGSEYYAYLGEMERGKGYIGTNVPQARMVAAQNTYEAVSKASATGLISAMTMPSLGGLGAAFLKLAFANGYGLDIDLDRVPWGGDVEGGRAREDTLLYSESTGRLVVTVPRDKGREFRAALNAAGIVFDRVGTVTEDDLIKINRGDDEIASAPIGYFRAAWKNAMRELSELPPPREADM